MTTFNRAREQLRKKLQRSINSIHAEWELTLGEESARNEIPSILRASATCLALPEDGQPEEDWEDETNEWTRKEGAA